MNNNLLVNTFESSKDNHENTAYLSTQLITYIGNKRSLLSFIGKALLIVQKRLKTNKLKTFDVFSGSGIVARYFKQFSDLLIVNDLEKYSYIINKCYLSNKQDINLPLLQEYYKELTSISNKKLTKGIIYNSYTPKDDKNIKSHERVFYTSRNAMYIDTIRQHIDNIPPDLQHYFLAPLLSEASIHSNTSGVFKGFYKNRETSIGQFGGKNQDALSRITSDIKLPFPVFSNFNCDTLICNADSNQILHTLPEVDLAYIDPPYNQHPYGSNYFMLNLIVDYKQPEKISKVSGIPVDWTRSPYNKRDLALKILSHLVENINAKYVLISFNSEGFISTQQMQNMLKTIGKLEILETRYNTFRACRNLNNRQIHVSEYLYLLEK